MSNVLTINTVMSPSQKEGYIILDMRVDNYSGTLKSVHCMSVGRPHTLCNGRLKDSFNREVRTWLSLDR